MPETKSSALNGSDFTDALMKEARLGSAIRRSNETPEVAVVHIGGVAGSNFNRSRPAITSP